MKHKAQHVTLTRALLGWAAGPWNRLVPGGSHRELQIHQALCFVYEIKVTRTFLEPQDREPWGKPFTSEPHFFSLFFFKDKVSLAVLTGLEFTIRPG